MQKCLSASVNRSAHQNFLTTPRLPQVQPLEQMSKEWEVDCQVPLRAYAGFYYMLFTSVSQVDFVRESVRWPGPLLGMSS